MTPRHRLAVLLGAAGFVGMLGTAAFAQAPPAPPTRIRGTIASLDGNLLSVTSRDGPMVKITLADPVTVSVPKKLELADIKANAYIGAAARPGPGGTLIAQEVVVIPESGRGSGEGHYPWDLSADSTMTNANVDALVTAANGRELTLGYKGGVTKVQVPEGTPIVSFGPGTKADLKTGAYVFIGAAKAPDGSFTAARVTVEKDGVKPPM